MTNITDELGIIAKFEQKLAERGKVISFFEADDTEHEVNGSPPKVSKETFGSGGAQQALTETIIMNTSSATPGTLPFSIFDEQKVQIDSETYFVYKFEEIRSGERIAAFKCFLGK